MGTLLSERLAELERARCAVAAKGVDGMFEELPCMAMVERGGAIVARNAVARALTGVDHSDEPVESVLIGASDFVGRDRRFRFDCLLLRKNGAPMQVNAVTQGVLYGGDACRLLLMVERVEGYGGSAEESGSFIEDVLDATPEATVIAHDGRILHVNREFSRLFGYPLVECAGRELDELVMPDGRLHENEIIYHMLEKNGRAEMETVRRARSGETMDMSVLVARVRLGSAAYGVLVTYRDIRRQKKEEARLHYNALHDGLTGLANRVLFLERVQLTAGRLRRRPDRCFSVIFLDLDGFKKVNDTLGHAAGDALLLEVARRLKSCLRPQDFVARFGGDEFALLLDESGNHEEVGTVATRIQAELRRPILIDGVEAFVSGSMGIAMATSAYASAEQMMMDADAAMYAAKASGKARHVIFGAELKQGHVDLSFQC